MTWQMAPQPVDRIRGDSPQKPGVRARVALAAMAAMFVLLAVAPSVEAQDANAMSTAAGNNGSAGIDSTTDDANAVTFESIYGRASDLPSQAWTIWQQGGWAMPAIAINALVMFALGMHVWLKLRGKGFQSVPERKWRRWIDHPQERRGPIGRMIDFVTGGQTLEDTTEFFEELRKIEITPFARDLRVMRICVSAAPLLGLLGTVTGMLSTFAALATGAGGDQTMDLVAQGISEALITTETGLVIALPGLFFQYQLVRLHEKYKAFLAHLETVCTQIRYRQLQAQQAA